MPGNNKRGYIALTSALIISFVVIAVTVALSISVYFSRFNIFDSQAKEMSLALAEGCADEALLKLAQNPSYAGNETITIETPYTCDILAIQVLGSQKTIQTKAVFEKATTKIKVVVNQTLLPSLVSWEEIP